MNTRRIPRKFLVWAAGSVAVIDSLARTVKHIEHLPANIRTLVEAIRVSTYMVEVLSGVLLYVVMQAFLSAGFIALVPICAVKLLTLGHFDIWDEKRFPKTTWTSMIVFLLAAFGTSIYLFWQWTNKYDANILPGSFEVSSLPVHLIGACVMLPIVLYSPKSLRYLKKLVTWCGETESVGDE